VRLLPEEAAPGGVFHRLHQWLDENVAQFGFYRPYRTYRAASTRAMASELRAGIRCRAATAHAEVFEAAVRASSILGKDLVLARITALYRQYVASVDARNCRDARRRIGNADFPVYRLRAADIYVGQVRSVLHQHAPNVQVIDLLHEAPAFNVMAGAHLLAALANQLQLESVTLAVVDPGVAARASRSCCVPMTSGLSGLTMGSCRLSQRGRKA